MEASILGTLKRGELGTCCEYASSFQAMHEEHVSDFVLDPEVIRCTPYAAYTMMPQCSSDGKLNKFFRDVSRRQRPLFLEEKPAQRVTLFVVCAYMTFQIIMSREGRTEMVLVSKSIRLKQKDKSMSACEIAASTC